MAFKCTDTLCKPETVEDLNMAYEFQKQLNRFPEVSPKVAVDGDLGPKTFGAAKPFLGFSSVTDLSGNLPTAVNQLRTNADAQGHPAAKDKVIKRRVAPNPTTGELVVGPANSGSWWEAGILGIPLWKWGAGIGGLTALSFGGFTLAKKLRR